MSLTKEQREAVYKEMENFQRNPSNGNRRYYEAVLEIIDQLLLERESELRTKIGGIVLAIDDSTHEAIKRCENAGEGFGAGQVWTFQRVLEALTPTTSKDKEKVKEKEQNFTYEEPFIADSEYNKALSAVLSLIRKHIK